MAFIPSNRDGGICKGEADLGNCYLFYSILSIFYSEISERPLKLQDPLLHCERKEEAGKVRHSHIPHGQPCGIPP